MQHKRNPAGVPLIRDARSYKSESYHYTRPQRSISTFQSSIVVAIASMTTFATRAPLQPILNSHMMSEPREHGRRTSKRLEQKEDAVLVNGTGNENEPLKGSQSDAGKPGKSKTSNSGIKSATKRKPGPGECPGTGSISKES